MVSNNPTQLIIALKIIFDEKSFLLLPFIFNNGEKVKLDWLVTLKSELAGRFFVVKIKTSYSQYTNRW